MHLRTAAVETAAYRGGRFVSAAEAEKSSQFTIA
jgi:hypothetical protein